MSKPESTSVPVELNWGKVMKHFKYKDISIIPQFSSNEIIIQFTEGLNITSKKFNKSEVLWITTHLELMLELMEDE